MIATIGLRAAGVVRVPTACRSAPCSASAVSRAATALRSSGAASLVGRSINLPAQRIDPVSAPGRRSTVQVEANCPIPPKSICYALSAAWLAVGLGNLFGLASADLFYKTAATPVVELMSKQMGTVMIAMAGAMCGEAHQHSAPTAAGLVFMSVACGIVSYMGRAYLTPNGLAATLALDVATGFFFLWKKYAEKSQAKLSMPSL